MKLYLQPGITTVSVVSTTAGAIVKPALPNIGYYELDSIHNVRSNKLIAFDKLKNTEDANGNLKQPYFDQRVGIDTDHQKALFKMVADNPSSPVSLLIIKYYSPLDAKFEDINPYYQLLSAELKQTKSGQRIAGYLERVTSVEVGKPAPDFTMNNPERKPISLSSYKGKYVLIDFWASWCGPCREDNPGLLALYKKFKAKGFDVLGVSLDSRLKDWKQAIAKDKLPWAHVSDLKNWENAVAKMYAVRYVPQKFLIDPPRQIIAHAMTMDELDSKLNGIFNQTK